MYAGNSFQWREKKILYPKKNFYSLLSKAIIPCKCMSDIFFSIKCNQIYEYVQRYNDFADGSHGNNSNDILYFYFPKDYFDLSTIFFWVFISKLRLIQKEEEKD